MASGVKADRIQRDEVKMHEPKKQAKMRKAKEMMGRKKSPSNAERADSRVQRSREESGAPGSGGFCTQHP